MIWLQWGCVPFIVIVDQLVKAWTVSNIPAGGEISLIPGIIRMIYVENTGSAFGMFSELTWALALLSAVAVCGLIFILVKRLFIKHTVGRWALFFLLGGAVGNLIDRLFNGFVVDMFEFQFVNFAIFNVADIFITAGEVLLFLYIVFFDRKTPTTPKKPENPSAQ